MGTEVKRAVVALTLALLCGIEPAAADNTDRIINRPDMMSVAPVSAAEVSIDEQYARLEQQMEFLRSRLDQQESTSTQSFACGDWRERATASGLYAGYEFLWMKPHAGQITKAFAEDRLGASFGTSVDVPHENYKLTPRVWLGYTARSGLGVRARYWNYDHEMGFDVADSDTGSDVLFSTRLDVTTVDLEVTQDFNWCSNRVTLFGGIRYAKVDQGFGVGVDVLFRPLFSVDLTHDFAGVGPSIGVDWQRDLGGSGLSVFVNAGGSILFGHTDRVIEIGAGRFFDLTAGLREQHAQAVSEIRVGVQYEHDIGRATNLLIRGAWEGQLWHDAGGPILPTGDLGLEGFGIAIGLSR